MTNGFSVRWTAILAGLAGIVGVLMLGESFHINNGPPLTASDSVFLAFVATHREKVLWGAWLQAAGPALIIALALTLVSLAKASGRVSGMLTIFGGAALMTTSLMEIACYIAGLFTNPPNMPRIAETFGFAIQHLYFFVAAPALFLSLGCVLLGSKVLPKLFAWIALLLGSAFVVLGLLHIDELVLPTPVTAFAAVQALWWFAAALVLIFRSGRIAREYQ